MSFLMFAVWLILNGKVTMEICLFGAVISATLLLFMFKFMDYSWKKELLLYSLVPFFAKYIWVLIEEIVKANVCVLKLILTPGLEPEPALVYFDTQLNSQTAKMILANSITLTPGTITVSVEDSKFCVHCLDTELAEGLEDSVFVKLLEEMEEKKKRWGC